MKKIIGMVGASAALAAIAVGGISHAAKNQNDVQNEYIRRLWQKVDSLEKKTKALESRPAGSGAGGGGGASAESVNLDTIVTDPRGPIGKNHHKLTNAEPSFKVFFDLALVSRPGSTSDLSFVNYHGLLLFEILPDSQLQFGFEISTNPRYYELDYQVTPKVQIRAGKIWIPFDDMAPHNIFGGRVNVSRLSLSTNGSYFLPDLWAELGVGAKFVPIDTTALVLTFHGYIVNGMRSGGIDPMGIDTEYPSFSDGSISIAQLDNNRDKAFGGRAHALLANGLGFGASFYNGRWTSESTTSQRLSILGIDAQLRVGPAEFRAGLANMKFGLPSNDSVSRGGYYGEAGARFGGDRKWKALARFGSVQLDNRVIDITDQQLLGGTLLWKPGLIEFSLEHSRDVKSVPNKPTTTYTAARMVVAL